MLRNFVGVISPRDLIIATVLESLGALELSFDRLLIHL